MILERLTVENFRQYYERQRIEFARDRHKNVSVIHGMNGAGKTSLFLSINWCLYGEGVDNVGELISKESLSRAKPGETVTAFVELAFVHDGSKYIARRTLSGIKQPDGKINIDIPGDFIMNRIGGDGMTKKVDNPVGTLNSILPSNVRTYFLFDGEKIDNFARPESGAEVKDAIYLVLKLEILDRARRHLETAAADYRRQLKKLSGSELRSLVENEELTRTKREKAEKRKAELEKSIQLAKRKIEEIGLVLRDSQESKSLQEKRDRLNSELRERQAQLEENIENTRELVNHGYLILAEPAINHALQVLEQKRERGEIPGNIRQQFIQDLIDRMCCICGRPFEKDSPAHQQLLELKIKTLPGSLEDDILDTSAMLKQFKEEIFNRRGDIDDLMKKRAFIIDTIKSLEAEVDDISRQLKSSPLEKISALEKKRQEFVADIDSYNMEIGSLTERVTKYNGEIDNLSAEIDRARKDEKRLQLETIKLNLAQRAADAIGEIYNTFADNMRLKIEARTKEIFKKLIWKNSHFQDVRLAPDFNLEVFDRYSLPARPELSAGERQVLSLSFITAMSRISEEEAPLVMDTPFGRLSSNHRESITEHLPELADQLILFVTDEELRDKARKNLDPKIGAEYRLEFNRATSCTEIIEVK